MTARTLQPQAGGLWRPRSATPVPAPPSGVRAEIPSGGNREPSPAGRPGLGP